MSDFQPMATALFSPFVRGEFLSYGTTLGSYLFNNTVTATI